MPFAERKAMPRQIIQEISDEPVTYCVVLPDEPSDAIPPGTWDAAKYFTQAISDVRRKHPELEFQVLPFEFSEPVMTRTEMRGPALTAVMLVGS
jgi:hypothetical protein